MRSPKRRINTRGSGGGKKKQCATEFDYDDYDSIVDCIDNYKANIFDLVTKVTQLKGRRLQSSDTITVSLYRCLTFIYPPVFSPLSILSNGDSKTEDTQVTEQPGSLEDEVQRSC